MLIPPIGLNQLLIYLTNDSHYTFAIIEYNYFVLTITIILNYQYQDWLLFLKHSINTNDM